MNPNLNLDSLKNLTVLYAEDDKVTRDSISRILSVFFAKVIVVEDGAKALEVYEVQRPNIVILDIRMPFINGLELASIIRKKDILTPIIIATSYKVTEEILQAVCLNLASYIIKPFGFEELRVALLESLKRLDMSGMLNKKISDTLSYDFTTKSLSKSGEYVKLTKREVLFFELLLSRRGSLVSYEQVEDILDLEQLDSRASMKNIVLRLRKKLDVKLIINIQDLGYMVA
jgi:two-component system, OmpR family, response regulator VanR